jgi:hypothetical protein
MRGYGLVGFVIAISLMAGPIPTALRFVAGVTGFVYLYVTWRYGGGRGVEVRPDGIYVRRWFRVHFIPWRGVKVFCVRRPALSPTVYVELISGETRTLPFTQGRQVSWKEGKSRDVVTVLNGELSLNPPIGRLESWDRVRRS